MPVELTNFKKGLPYYNITKVTTNQGIDCFKVNRQLLKLKLQSLDQTKVPEPLQLQNLYQTSSLKSRIENLNTLHQHQCQHQPNKRILLLDHVKFQKNH